MLGNKDLKKKKELKAAELRHEDVKLYRLMVEFILAIVLVSAVITAGSGNEIFIIGTVLPILNIVTAFIFAATAINFVVVKRRGTDETDKIITSAGLFGNAAVLFLSGAHYYLFMDAKQLSFSLVIIALLYFVYSIYEESFFDFSVFAAIGFLALSHSMLDVSIFSYFARLLVKGALVLAFIVPVFTLIRAIIKTAKGKTTAKYLACTILAALIIVAGAVFVLVYPSAVIYTYFALLAVYLATTVVYTVKMM